jgi:uncharacterized repeat protein (TIGR03803 family)
LPAQSKPRPKTDDCEFLRLLVLGVVFKIDPSSNETVLYNFTGGADGGFPLGGLIRDSAGNLYGTTNGGGASGAGVVFTVDRAGKEKMLYSFT